MGNKLEEYSIHVCIHVHDCQLGDTPVVDTICTSIKIIKNEVGCRDDTVPKTVDTRRHCEEE